MAKTALYKSLLKIATEMTVIEKVNTCEYSAKPVSARDLLNKKIYMKINTCIMTMFVFQKLGTLLI